MRVILLVVLVAGIAGCGIQFGSEEPAIRSVCGDTVITTVPIDDDALAAEATAGFGTRAGEAVWQDGSRVAVTATLTSASVEVQRQELNREPTEDDRLYGCIDGASWDGQLDLVTVDGALDETIPVRIWVDAATRDVVASGWLEEEERRGTWAPILEDGEWATGLGASVTWRADTAMGAVEAGIEGKNETASWDGGRPVLEFTVAP